MENEVNLKEMDLNEQLVINNNIYKLDYENQKVDNNINFISWKKSMLKEYGNDAKLFRCQKCNILFYSNNIDIKKEPYYSIPCPICKLYICYFCLTSFKSYSKNNKIYCCKRRIINICFFISGPQYTGYNNLFDFNIFIFLIPIMNIFGLLVRAYSLLFYSLPLEKSKKNGNLRHHEKSTYSCLQLMSFIIAILLGIQFFFIDSYHIIFLFLISIPFKFWPLKYYLGVVDINLEYFRRFI